MRVWKPHGIGPGKLINYENIYVDHQSHIGTCTSDNQYFQFQKNDMREVKKNTRLKDEEETDTEQLLFHCLEPGCKLSFKSFNEYDLHMVVGDHTNTSEGTESIYNKVKRDWAKMFTTLSLTARNPRPAEDSVSAAVSVMEGNICRVNYNVLPRGWALKQLKGLKLFPPNIKNYLEATILVKSVGTLEHLKTLT